MSVVSRTVFGCLVLACVAQGCAPSDAPDTQGDRERDVTPNAPPADRPPSGPGDPDEERSRAAQDAADEASEIDGDELKQMSSPAGAGDTSLAAVCDDDPLGSFDYCSSTCLCGVGEGDCDDDDDCDTGLACMRDTGALFGFDPEVDVCMERCSSDALGTPDFCSPECPCEAGQGDCDRNYDCAAGNLCAKNVGASFGFKPDVDVCIDVCDPLLNGTFDYCSSDCLCEHGKGDCDSDADCAPGHVCARDAGASYGFDPEMDVCEQVQTPQESFTGRVIDQQGRPVDGATVSVNQVSTVTDEDGLFALSVDVTVDARYVINAERFRHVPHSSIHLGGGIEDLTLTLAEAQMITLTATTTDIDGDGGTSIALSEPVQDALVDENGDPPRGPIVAQVHTFDVVNEGMVGNMEAVDANGDLVVLESVGAVSVDFFDLDGREYRLGPGKTAQISIQVSPEIDYSGPIPLWYYDREQGRWIEEGEGIVQDGMAYGTVTHFSEWNFDMKFSRSSCIKVTTSLTQDGDFIEARINVTPPADSGSPPASRLVTFTRTAARGNDHVLFNLPERAEVEILIPPDGSDLRLVANSGAAWALPGESGVRPPDDYNRCNGHLVPSGPVVIGTPDGQIRGVASLLSHSVQSDITIDVTSTSPGGPRYTTRTLETGMYTLPRVTSEQYHIRFSYPERGYLPVDTVTDPDGDGSFPVESGKIRHLSCVRLLAGNVDKNGVIDDADRDALNDRLAAGPPTNPALDFPYDVDGSGRVDDGDASELGRIRVRWGVLENGQRIIRTLPMDHPAVQCPSSRVDGIAAGAFHTCALIGGKVLCWGASGNGQLGYGDRDTIGDDETLIGVNESSIDASASAISTGGYHSCALVSGEVRCWGRANAGQLGLGLRNQTQDIGDNEESADFTAYDNVNVGFNDVVQLVSGLFHTCALSQSGRVRCWGDNSFGQLGYPGRANVGIDETPGDMTDVNLGGSAVSLAAGAYHTCAIMVDRKLVRCWGANEYGQLGYGTTDNVGDDETPAEYPFPVATPGVVDPKVNPADNILSIAAGYDHTCALLNNSRMRCWGSRAYGQLGYGGDSRDPVLSPVGQPIVPLRTAGNGDFGGDIDLVAGGYHTCALIHATADSDPARVTCWGRGNYGQLGRGNFDDQTAPPEVGIVLSGPPVALAAGLYHTCAILTLGDDSAQHLQCWGRGSFGQLGYGNTGNIGGITIPRDAGIVPFLD